MNEPTDPQISSPLVSVIILNWNGSGVIAECLDAVRASTYKNVEIIVVDNGSTDDSLNIARHYTDVRIIENKQNLGYAAGNNRGLLQARGEYMVTLNNDAVVTPGWLEQPVAMFASDQRIGIIACRQMEYARRDYMDCLYGYPLASLRFQPMGNGRRFNANDPLLSEAGYVMSAGGAAAIYRKAFIHELGGFDERYGSFHEESDLCLRAFLSGWACAYAPDAVVFHMGHFSFDRVKKHYAYLHERNRFWFIFKFFPAAIIVKNIIPLLIMELRVIKWSIFKWKAVGSYYRARRDGFAGLAELLPDRKKWCALFKEKYPRYRLFMKEKKLPLS
jgi:GT2 family glycosyltransferase